MWGESSLGRVVLGRVAVIHTDCPVFGVKAKINVIKCPDLKIKIKDKEALFNVAF